MAPIVADEMVVPIMATLLECYRIEIAKVANPPRLTGFRPGVQIEAMLSANVDECCLGLAWVRPVSFYPSRDFPNPDTDHQNCAPTAWAIALEVGSLRCAPTPPANAIAAPAEWDALTIAIQDDAAAMRRALCCFADADPDRFYKFDLWQPLATEGRCAGGAMQVTISAMACDCTLMGIS